MAKVEYSYKAAELITKFREYAAYKGGILKEWRLIRSLYKGDFWTVFRKYLKEYTITPDCNYFEYVVQGYLNSVYSGAFIGTVSPRNEEDTEKVDALNAFIAYNWNKWGMKNRYLHVGENGELYNLGALRVDWNSNKKTVIVKTMSPQELYFDPSVDCYKDGEAIFIERAVNIDTLAKDTRFEKGLEAFKLSHKNSVYSDKTAMNRIAGYENQQGANNKTLSFIECFIRNSKGKIDQIFILDETDIIYEKTDIPFDTFPIVCYTPQRPDGNPYGTSKLVKIMNTVIALNLLDSLEATQPYRLLNRVRFVNVAGNINMRSFADYGNTPGASFEVRGDPRTIVYYQEVPTVPDLTNIKKRLEDTIFQVTGVDPYYKGRATNSVQTTGATQAFQARVTMLTDNSRITLLEEFCEDLTRLIIGYYYMFGAGEVYKVPKLSATGINKVTKVQKLTFNEYHNGTDAIVPFDYHIDASTLLPMNHANLFESAKALYEMQGQYQFKTPIITPEELIRYSDFPQKDLWLQRLAKEGQESIANNLVGDLSNFASIFSKMLAQGMTEEQAAQQALSILIEEKNAIKEDPAIGQGLQ